MGASLPAGQLTDAVFEASLDAVFLVDRDGVVRRWSGAAQRLYGWRADEIVGQSFLSLLAEAQRPLARQRLEGGWGGTIAGPLETVHLRRTGGRFRALVNVRRLRDDRERDQGALLVVRELSALEEVPEAGARVQQQMGLLGWGEVDLSGPVPVPNFSPELRAALGLPTDEPVTFESLDERIHPDDLAEVQAARARAFERREPLLFHFRQLRPGDLAERWFQVVGFPDTGRAGSPPRIIVSLWDVTDRRQTSLRLAETDARLRQLEALTHDGVVVRSNDGAISFANRRAEEMFGYGRGEMVGQSAMELLLDEDKPLGRRLMEERSRGQSYDGERTFLRRDGSLLFCRAHAEPILDARGKVVAAVATFTDLGSERRARSAEWMVQALVSSSVNAIYSRTTDGTILTWNGAAERLTGYTASEVVGRDAARIYAETSRGPAVRDAINSGAQRFATTVLRKDGSLVEVEVDGFPLIDGDGRTVGAGIVLRDLTEERKAQAELKRMEDQLSAARKLEAIGSLAGGIAHDFNNVLTVILSCADLAGETVGPDSEVIEDLTQISDAARRAAALTQRLLAFGRQQVLKPVPLDLAAQARLLLPMMRRLLGEAVLVEVVAPEAAPRVLADPSQVEQVLLNLAVNSRDAMPQGGSLQIQIAALDLDEAFARAHLDVKAGPHVMLAVRDSGVGMSDEVKARIFEPFFSTKGERGTGLGLATVHGIVRQSGGTIWVESEPGAGTVFRIYFPVTEASDQPAPVASRPASSARGGETILLVEDDSQVRDLVAEVLRRAGYTVFDSAGPGDALLFIDQHAGPLDLLLTDVVMPRMNGREMAERIATRRPGLPILFMSGYTDDAVILHGVKRGMHDLLEKPLTPARLLAKVREVLDR